MKKCRTFSAVAAAAVLVFAGQAFAMTGGQVGGTHSMSASMLHGNAGKMQQGSMPGTGSKQGTMTGTGPQSMGQSGAANGSGHQQVAKHGNGTAMHKQ